MKKLNANEMRKVDGSFRILAGIAVVAGTSIGKAIRIRYEHARYGKCYTYPKSCWTCKHRW